MRFSTLALTLFMATVVLQSSAVSAMSFKLHPNNSDTLLAIPATGEIEFGDTERLERFILSNPRKKNAAVYLASRGGYLYEGMKIGRLLKQYGIKSVVEGGELCASACAIAFLGGHDGNGWPWRSSSDNSRLGFHAFSSGQGRSEGETQQVVSDVLAYARDVQAPLQLMILNFATQHESIYWLTENEMCSLGIKVWSNTTSRFIC